LQKCKKISGNNPLNSSSFVLAWILHLYGQEPSKEDRKMKTNEMAKKGLYTGAGAGLALFAILGLLPGSFIGGMIGINIAGSIFGLPLEPSLVPRLIVGASMILGVFLSGVIFVVGTSSLGWLIGTSIDSVRMAGAVPATEEVESK
jgi:hypothetical protein